MNEEELQLDGSRDSIDRLEAYYFRVLDGSVKADRVATRKKVTAYLGRFTPDASARVTDAETWRIPGLMRDRIEQRDVALQRQLLAALTSDLDATLARLRDDATALAGEDPGVLDGTPALGKYEPALARARRYAGTPELRRRFRRGLTVAIGALLQAELGASEWEVDDDPKGIDLGVWKLFGIRLTHTVERTDPAKEPGLLRANVEKMIANRREKKRRLPDKQKKATTPKGRGGRLGKWFVLCPKSRALSMKDVLAKVKMPSSAQAKVVRDVLVVDVHGHEVQVGLDDSRVVLAEAVELAEEYGAKRPDRARIATYDARYVISWYLAESEHVFEAYYTLAFRLAKTVRGVTFDPMERRFVDA